MRKGGPMTLVKNEYQAYYAERHQRSLEFQDFVMKQLALHGIFISFYCSQKYQYEEGESLAGIEIKFDDMFSKTGNLYIEYEEKSHPNNKNYVPSGIERKDNSWLWVQGNYEVLYIFAKKDLKRYKTELKVRHIVTPTSKGYLLPAFMSDEYAAHIIRVNKKDSCKH